MVVPRRYLLGGLSVILPHPETEDSCGKSGRDGECLRLLSNPPPHSLITTGYTQEYKGRDGLGPR